MTTKSIITTGVTVAQVHVFPVGLAAAIMSGIGREGMPFIWLIT